VTTQLQLIIIIIIKQLEREGDHLRPFNAQTCNTRKI
jgi:hypothetical protein